MTPTVQPPGPPVPYSSGGFGGECDAAFRDLPIDRLPWSLSVGEAQILPSGVRVVSVKVSAMRQMLCVERPGPDGRPEPVYVKRYLPRNAFRAGLSGFGTCRAEREWQIGREALRRGVPAALPVLWARNPASGIIRESCLAIMGVGDHVSFARLWREAASPGERVGLLRLLAPFIRKTHDLGFIHVDMRAKHILASGRPDPDGAGPDFRFIDVDRCRFTRGPAGTYARMSSLYWLFRSLRFEQGPSDLRETFLAAYRGGEPVSGLGRALAWLAFKVKVLRTADKRRRRERRNSEAQRPPAPA